MLPLNLFPQQIFHIYVHFYYQHSFQNEKVLKCESVYEKKTGKKADCCENLEEDEEETIPWFHVCIMLKETFPCDGKPIIEWDLQEATYREHDQLVEDVTIQSQTRSANKVRNPKRHVSMETDLCS